MRRGRQGHAAQRDDGSGTGCRGGGYRGHRGRGRLPVRAPRVAGAARTSPHSLVQEFLNRSDDHLWAFLSNGKQLRILRDNASLTRQAYVEFDLEAMMEGEVYADFALQWLLCHQSRVEGEVPEEFWLERWSQAAQAQGTRALEQLREGVESAISVLGAASSVTHQGKDVAILYVNAGCAMRCRTAAPLIGGMIALIQLWNCAQALGVGASSA